jgi:hypothetical protein
VADDALADLLRSARDWFDVPSGDARGIYGTDLRRVVERHGLKWAETKPEMERLIARWGGSHREVEFVSRGLRELALRRPATRGRTTYYELPQSFFEGS